MNQRFLRAHNQRLLIESHRGCELIAPENSWPGIEAGHARGADLIEVDVQISADEVPFLRHSYSLPDGRLPRTMRWEELAPVEIEGCRLPRLDEVLAWAVEKDTMLALDLKAAFIEPQRLGRAVLDSIERTTASDHVVLLGFDHVLLRWLKQAQPDLPTELLIRARPIDTAGLMRAAQADVIALYYDLIRPADVEAAHQAGAAVTLTGLWQPDFEYADGLGVDIIVWGDPAEARRGLGYDAG